jgi:hypothetical protein
VVGDIDVNGNESQKSISKYKTPINEKERKILKF